MFYFVVQLRESYVSLTVIPTVKRCFPHLLPSPTLALAHPCPHPYSPVQPSRPQSDGPNNNVNSNYRPEKHRCIVDTSLCIQYHSYIPLGDKRELSPTTAKSFRKLCVANHPIVVPFCHTRPVVPIAAADITAVFVLFDIDTRQSTNNTASLVRIGSHNKQRQSS